MTTAARPTFDTAKGGSGMREKELSKLTQLVSSRDLPAHLTLKIRLPGQDTKGEVTERNLRVELETRERDALLEKSKSNRYRFVPSLEEAATLRLANKAEKDKERASVREALLECETDLRTIPSATNSIDLRRIAQIDADDDFGDIDDSESDFEDDEDDPAELMAELDRIKQERLAEDLKRKEEELAIKNEVHKKSSVTDTPSSFSLKRRWDDDVPFKNCARQETEPKKKLYLNDTIRQEFHRKFMDKYIK